MSNELRNNLKQKRLSLTDSLFLFPYSINDRDHHDLHDHAPHASYRYP